jgi:hypothetical protein
MCTGFLGVLGLALACAARSASGAAAARGLLALAGHKQEG